MWNPTQVNPQRMKRIPTKDPRFLRAVNEFVSNSFMSGRKDLYVIKGWDGNKVELVHFRTLLQFDICSSVISTLVENKGQTVETMQEMFPVHSVVWVEQEGEEGIRFTEATELDERAKWETQEAVRKLNQFVEQVDEGQKRLNCIYSSFLEA